MVGVTTLPWRTKQLAGNASFLMRSRIQIGFPPSDIRVLSSEQRACPPPLPSFPNLDSPSRVNECFQLQYQDNLPLARADNIPSFSTDAYWYLERLDVQQNHHAICSECGWLLSLFYSLTLPLVAALTYRGRNSLVLHCRYHLMATALPRTSAWAMRMR